MAKQDMSKLSRYDMVDIIYTLEKNETELRGQLEQQQKTIENLRTQLTIALQVAKNALELRNYFGIRSTAEEKPAPKDEESKQEAQ